jgi:hypothetical protein
VGCSSTITVRRPEVAQPLEPAGFYWSGFLCLILAVLKLRLEAHWSWWRVLLPFWAVLGHNILYITVGFVWLSFADDGTAEEEATIRQGHGGYRYQLAALVCFVIFADNVLRANRGIWGDDMVLGEFGPMGTDFRVWDTQCGFAASVLV